MTIEGRCACGAVSFVAEGQPLVQLICHCASCQIAHGAPLVFGAQFPPDRFSSSGRVEVVTVSKDPGATRRMTCPECGTRVFNGWGGAPRTIFPSLCSDAGWFRPEMHLYWQNRRIEVVDDLPKYLDFPTQFGGTGRRA